MLINTKFSIGDAIWFIVNASLFCSNINGIEVFTDEKETKTVYYADVPGPSGQPVRAVIGERHAFSSKDELINTITERYYETLEPGSG